MSILDFIKRQITRYRDRLANLSRRNKELYYRENRGYCINLTKRPNIKEEHSELITKQFQPLRCLSPTFQNLLNKSTLDLDQHFLIQETQNTQLMKRLDKIRLADNKFQREYGIAGAWLLGPFLCWRDKIQSQPEDLLISPIFKIAINISKNKKKEWTLNIEDNTLTINPSLRLALRLQCGIDLPEALESDQIQDALEEFKHYITQHSGKTLIYDKSNNDSIPRIAPRYKLIKDEYDEIIDKIAINIVDHLSEQELDIYNNVTNKQFMLMDVIYIDHLSANRVSLLRDYDKILDESEMHPILSELFLGKPIPVNRGEDHERIKALDGYKEKENYFVVNVDSAQHRAIDQTNQNRTIVIQGPPGTGKSQTITNLISDCLSKGKKVLFVSEKRAALDVVQARLQQANLASQSVLIHSSNLNKQSLYNSFLELSNSVHDEDTDKQWELITSALDTCKAELNKYYSILETKHAASNLLISELLSISAEIVTNKIDLEIVKLFSNFSYHELKQICVIIDELETNVKKVSGFSSHPWLYRKQETVYTDSLVSAIFDLIANIKQSEDLLKSLENKLISVSVENGSYLVSDLSSFEKISASIIPPEWVDFLQTFYLDTDKLLSYQHLFKSTIDKIEKLKGSYDLFRTNIDIDIRIVEQLEAYYYTKRGILDWFTPCFWKMRSIRNEYLSSWDGTNTAFKDYILIYRSILHFKSVEQNKLYPFIIDEFNPMSIVETYTATLPLLQTIKGLNAIIIKLNPSIKDKFEKLTIESYKQIKEIFQNFSEVSSQIGEIQQKLCGLKEQLNSYLPHNLNSDPDLIYNELVRTIKELDLIDAVDLCLLKLDHILSKQMLIEKLIPLDIKWGSFVLDTVTKWWIDEIRSTYPELRTFNKEIFHKKIKHFIKLEDDHRQSARDFVNNTLFKRWNKGLEEFEGLSLLKREANKKNKVKPPREIMEKGALSTMFKLKPCWLMSPLSISQILPLEKGLFDTIIFDEASQVRVEDAVPSIYRANSMVVVGDPKQMPPTNFFFSSNTEDDDNENIELSTSILDLATQIYPSEILEWHYRSRSESLIAYSNRAFYGGRLIAVPNPNYITEGNVIKFHEVNNAYFNKDNGNLIEAEAVVERLAQLLKTEPNKSYGIIAMGQPQMLAIENAIERKKLSYSMFSKSIESAENYIVGDVDAGLFVKNLENVQGDERDIILISVGYAALSPGKKVYMNFGPLSKAGGGCRLNVAITRAKHKLEIFCSFDPNQIATDENDFAKNPDLVLFGRYLKYTKAISERRHTEALSILNSFGIGAVITTRKSSNFSKNVKKRLEDLGYTVSAEVGSSGFYIDLAVHHPVIPTNFILGIECDGALFHSTPYARDRDKIRQELLESRGWKILRIWSQDWSKNWQEEINKIDLELKKIISAEVK